MQSITLPVLSQDHIASAPGGSIQFIGTATTLIQHRGFTLLTDPNFLHAGQHVHLGYGLHSERLTEPALQIRELPPLDLCLLSHLHGDHWDEVAEKELPKSLPIVTTHHAAAGLQGQGFTCCYPLNTWQQFMATRGPQWLRVTAMPGKHGPLLMQALLPTVMGSLLEWGEGSDDPHYRMYISGDTLLIDDLHEIPKRFGDIDLALLHLGGTRILRVLLTMDARQGVRALQIIQPKMAIPIHYNDYTVFKSPVEDFLNAARDAGWGDRVTFLKHGEVFQII